MGFALTNNPYFRVWSDLTDIENHYMVRSKKNELFQADEDDPKVLKRQEDMGILQRHVPENLSLNHLIRFSFA